jgi:hypothetical protein
MENTNTNTNTNTTLDILGMLTGLLKGIVATLVAAELENLGLTPETLRAWQRTVDQVGAIDAGEIGLDYAKLAGAIDLDDLVRRIDTSDFASDLARHIDTNALAEEFSHEDIAGSIAGDDSAMASIARCLIRAMKTT